MPGLHWLQQLAASVLNLALLGLFVSDKPRHERKTPRHAINAPGVEPKLASMPG